MKSRSSLLAMSLLGALIAITAARCSSDNTPADAGATHKDAGNQPDSGQPDATLQQDDGGDAGEPDAGYVDAGPIDTTVVAINNQEADEHPAVGSQVVFTAVVVVPPYIVQKPKSADTTGDCLWATFISDATAPGPEHNGLMVTSFGTYDFTARKCNLDSKLHTETALAAGDEVSLKGLYYEFCGGQSPCTDTDQNGVAVTFPQVACNQDGDVTRTGQTPGIPSYLPATVTVSDVYSEGAVAPFTLGAKFRTYRAVQVKVENVEVVNTNPDAPKEYCDFTVAAAGTTTPTLRVSDDLPGINSFNCDYRPLNVGTSFDWLQGILYWSFGSAKLLPRNPHDGFPNISAGEGAPATVTQINNIDHPVHPASGTRVTFKAIAVSPAFVISSSGCLYGLFMADRAEGPDYNGVVVYAQGAKDGSGKCVVPADDPLHQYEMSMGSIRIGEEYKVTGTYTEYCYKTSGSQQCQDQFGNKGISIPEVQVFSQADFQYQGYPLRGVPYTPPVVTPGDIYSTRNASGTITALGSSWWQYRCVFVDLQNVKVVNTNPDSGDAKDFCEWGIATTGSTTPMLRVDDAVMYEGSTCPHRPAMDTVYTDLKGFLYWANKDSKLLPRTTADATPNLP